MSIYEKEGFKAPNKLLDFLFKIREWIVVLGLLLTVSAIVVLKYVYHQELKDVIYVAVGIIALVTLLYHILNVHQSYEANYSKLDFDKLKYENDKAYSKLTLSYTMAAEFTKSLNNHSMIATLFILKNKQLIDEGNIGKFNDLLQGDYDSRVSVIAVLNYFDLISNAVEKQLVDELFMKDFFYSLFNMYYENLKEYITFRCKLANNQRIFYQFTKVASHWSRVHPKLSFTKIV